MISRFPGSTLFCRLVKPALCLPQVLLEFLPFLLGGEQIARQPVNSGGVARLQAEWVQLSQG